MNNSKTITLNYHEIIDLIPHRYPFLLIDRVEQIIVNESATGIKNVTINENFFNGHFPEFPVMPGVLIVESMAQTAACLMSYSNKSLQKRKVVFLTGIENTKFKKMTTPGDILKLKVKVISNRKNFYKFSATAHIEDFLVATSNFSAMLQS
jgi:3-hydroxyacyl-[acyl-carrier-protein] dehydratase